MSAQNSLKMWIWRLWFINGLYMIVLHHIFSSSSYIFERLGSETTYKIWWNNSMFCSFPRFISLRFLCLGTSEVYCLCYRSKWLPGLQTMNTEWIWYDWFDRWYFIVSQTIVLQMYTYNFLGWRSEWTLRTFCLIIRMPQNGSLASESLYS